MPAIKVYYTKKSRKKPTIDYYDTIYDAEEEGKFVLRYWDNVEEIEIIDKWGDVVERGWPAKREEDKPRSKSPVEELNKAFSEGKKSIRM